MTLTAGVNAENAPYVKLTIPIILDGLPLQGNRRWTAGEGFLYRLYGERDRLLWVGSTCDLKRRLRQHRTRKTWWPEVVRCEAQWFSDVHDAWKAEWVALVAERPAHNLMLIGSHPLPYRRERRAS